jgi:hypothetical protein
MSIMQVFCTIADVIEALDIPGEKESILRRHVWASSEFLAKEIGWFVPVTSTFKVDGSGTDSLIIPPILDLTNITHDGIALTSNDYLLYPSGREWLNGPYSWIKTAEGGKIIAWQDESQVVEITARRGLYDLVGLTGTALNSQQLIGDVEITVKNGSIISPGLIIKIDNEQQLVDATNSPVSSGTTNAVAIAPSDDEITLTDDTKVAKGETIRIDFEEMKIIDKNTTTHKCKVGRGWNKTQKTTHVITTGIDVYRKFQVIRAINGTTAAAHADAAPISYYQMPADLGFLAREIAGLMLKKEQSGYAGRTGNVDLGTVFYNDMIPRDDLARIKKLYTIKGK